MSKTIDFTDYRMKKMAETGEANFICCPKCRGEEWAVGVMSDGNAPFIYALVCISEICDGKSILTVEEGSIDGEFIA